MNTKRILVAGMGNNQQGGDAFGRDTVRELSKHHLPEAVEVVDFGVRSDELACAIADDHEVIILATNATHGEEPGTVYLTEPDLSEAGSSDTPMDVQGFDPARVLRKALTLGGKVGRVYVVGCEPCAAEGGDGPYLLGGLVQESVPRAVHMIESIFDALLGKGPL